LLAYVDQQKQASYHNFSSGPLGCFGGPAEPIENQIGQLREISRTYNRAVVRAFDGPDEALLHALELEYVYVQRVTLSRSQRAASSENLRLLMRRLLIGYPDCPELSAELDVFKSDFTFNG
jgi:hypothetical protein